MWLDGRGAPREGGGAPVTVMVRIAIYSLCYVDETPAVVTRGTQGGRLYVAFVSVSLGYYITVLHFLFLGDVSFLLRGCREFLVPRIFSPTFVSCLARFVPSFRLLSMVL